MAREIYWALLSDFRSDFRARVAANAVPESCAAYS